MILHGLMQRFCALAVFKLKRGGMWVAQIYTGAGTICPWSHPHASPALLASKSHPLPLPRKYVLGSKVSCLPAVISLWKTLTRSSGMGSLLQRLLFFFFLVSSSTEQVHLVANAPCSTSNLVPVITPSPCFLHLLVLEMAMVSRQLPSASPSP